MNKSISLINKLNEAEFPALDSVKKQHPDVNIEHDDSSETPSSTLTHDLKPVVKLNGHKVEKDKASMSSSEFDKAYHDRFDGAVHKNNDVANTALSLMQGKKDQVLKKNPGVEFTKHDQEIFNQFPKMDKEQLKKLAEEDPAEFRKFQMAFFKIAHHITFSRSRVHHLSSANKY